MAASSSYHASHLVGLCALLAVAMAAPEWPRTVVADRIIAAPRADRTPGSGGEAPVLPAGVAPDWWSAVEANLQAQAFDVRPDTGRARAGCRRCACGVRVPRYQGRLE